MNFKDYVGFSMLKWHPCYRANYRASTVNIRNPSDPDPGNPWASEIPADLVKITAESSFLTGVFFELSGVLYGGDEEGFDANAETKND